MAKKTAQGGKPESDPAEAEHPLQAVVIADSVNERFMPITLEKPRVRSKYHFITIFTDFDDSVNFLVFIAACQRSADRLYA